MTAAYDLADRIIDHGHVVASGFVTAEREAADLLNTLASHTPEHRAQLVAWLVEAKVLKQLPTCFGWRADLGTVSTSNTDDPPAKSVPVAAVAPVDGTP